MRPTRSLRPRTAALLGALALLVAGCGFAGGSPTVAVPLAPGSGGGDGGSGGGNGVASLSWDPSSSPDVVGYRVYYWTDARDVWRAVDVGNQTEIAVGDLGSGS